MNATYIYNTQEASSLITNRIYYLLESHNWSVKTLSDESNIPYETLKKLLSRKTENTSFHNIMKIALAFNCNLDYLVEPLEETKHLYPPKILASASDFCDISHNEVKIPLFYPGDAPQPSPVNALNISAYPDYIKQTVEYGIVISTYCYHPIYKPDDVLLISRKHPPSLGEIGVFLHLGKLYIRVFYQDAHFVILKPVNDIGPNIRIRDFSEWTIAGHVVGVHKMS